MAAEALPPLPWSAGGSVALRAGAALARRLERPVAALFRALDSAGRALDRDAIRSCAAAALGIPVLRLLLGDAAATGLVWILAATAGAALLLRVAGRLHGETERAWVLRALLLGLLLRVACAAAISWTGGFPDEREQYHPLARLAAAQGWGGAADSLAASPLVAGRWAYDALLTGTYLLLGPSLAAGRLLGILLGLAAALLAGEVARPLGGRRAAAFAVVVLALHPEAALWSAAVTRDGLTAALVLAALAVVARDGGNLRPGRFLLAAGPLALLAMNSLPATAALCLALVVALLLGATLTLREGTPGALRAVFAVLVALAALAAAREVLGAWLDPGQISLLRNGVFRGDPDALAARGALPADFLPGLRFDGWGDVAAYAPLGSAFALCAPWPWDAVHVHRAAYGILLLAGHAVALAGIVGLTAAARRAPLRAAAPVLCALALLLALALTEGNAGTLARHRAPLAAIFAVGTGVILAGLAGDGGRIASPGVADGRTVPS